MFWWRKPARHRPMLKIVDGIRPEYWPERRPPSPGAQRRVRRKNPDADPLGTLPYEYQAADATPCRLMMPHDLFNSNAALSVAPLKSLVNFAAG